MAKKVGARRGSQHGTARVLPGAQGGGRETCGGTLPSFHDVKTVHWRWPSSARGRGEKGADTSVLALEGHHLAVPDEMAREEQVRALPSIVRGRQTRPSVHQRQVAATPPPSTGRPGEESRVPFSSACIWGGVLAPRDITEPCRKVVWGSRCTSPGPGTCSAARSRHLSSPSWGWHLLRDSV